jgi:hypothetical protein
MRHRSLLEHRMDHRDKPTGVRLEKLGLFDSSFAADLILFRHYRAAAQRRDPVIQVSMWQSPCKFGSPGLRPAMTEGENGSEKV